MRRRRRCLAIVLTTTAVVGITLAAAESPAEAQQPPQQREPVEYQPPVDAPVVDTFRPPETPYGKGNRGIDYATAPGQPVASAAAGEVVFAGRVANGLHVVVLHDDGLRTSYSFLGGIEVQRGQRVEQHQRIGTSATAAGTDASEPLHFGVRAGKDVYLDPLVLFGQLDDDSHNQRRQRAAYLVADDPTEPLTEAEERRWLAEQIKSLYRSTRDGAEWLKTRAAKTVEKKIELARILVDDAIDLAIPMPFHLAVAAMRWEEEQRTCTPADTPIAEASTNVPTPNQPRQSRIVILVGGLGSSTTDTAIRDVDTEALGYLHEDVHQFSYRPDGGHPYEPEHTEQGIKTSGEQLADRINDLQRRNPNTPVDVIAHSQGGLVARSAITHHRAAPATVVTLATPHQGTDLATASAGLDASTSGHLLLEAISTTRPGDLDLNSTSMAQLSETSSFIRDLPEHGWSPHTHVVSIAARGDPIVPAHQSRLSIAEGRAHNTVVIADATTSPNTHRGLPGSPKATREIARALARQAPTCRSLVDTMADELISRQTGDLHDTIGAAATFAGLYTDHRIKAAAAAGVRGFRGTSPRKR